jgi:hypothetical protein
VNAIERLQADVFGYLRADDFFATVNILRISEQQIESDIDSQIALFVETSGKNGASLAVHLPTGHPGPDNVSGPQLELQIEVFVSVNKLINESTDGTGISEGALIERVLQDLHQVGIGPCSLVCASPAFEPFFKGDGIMVHRLAFKQVVNLPPATRVRQPSMVVGGGTVTLASGTAGATIYYTTDGSYPGTDATEYTDPFTTPASGTLIRAVAHKAGMAPSNLTQNTV